MEEDPFNQHQYLNSRSLESLIHVRLYKANNDLPLGIYIFLKNTTLKFIGFFEGLKDTHPGISISLTSLKFLMFKENQRIKNKV